MGQDITDQSKLGKFRRIGITPQAVKILGMIYVSCPITPSTLNRFNSVSRLADLFNIATLSMIDLATIAEDLDKATIEPDDIARLFGGEKHLKNLAMRAKGQGIIQSTGQSYRDRLAQLGISIETELNQAEFALIDMLVDGKVVDIKQDQAMVVKRTKKEDIVFENVYLANDDRIETGSIILIHYGMTIALVGEDITWEIVKQNRKEQTRHPYFQTQISKIDGTINCQKICNNSNREKKGFDIAKWARPRL